MELDAFLKSYGTLLGLAVYILVTDVIPFLRDKIWPSIREDKRQLFNFRRENDSRMFELEERKVIANEQVAKLLIIQTQKIEGLDKEIRRHDDHVTTVMTQMTSTLASMQSINNVLLDRITRPIPATD